MSRIESVDHQITPHSRRESLLTNILRLISTGNYTEELFESQADERVAPGWSVRELVESSLYIGEFSWQDGKLVFSEEEQSNSKE